MTTYSIRMLHVGQEDRVQDFKKAVAAELLHLGLHRSVTVAVSDTHETEDSPQLCVFLADAESRADDSLERSLNEALASGVLVVPVVESLRAFPESVPESALPLNGVEWFDETSLVRLVRIVLAELGIEESQRKVFISHRRTDGLGAAEQLHDRLSHLNFRPFIDRFAIRSGASVQDEIADALEDHAFLLLLETPDAHTSDWVFDEIDYALSHTMGVLIVSWPGGVPEVPGSHGVPRVLLSQDDVMKDGHDYDVLTEIALDRVLTEVEAAHASGLVRRRRMLVNSIEESAAAAGFKPSISLPRWRLRIETHEGVVVVGTTPRLPSAEDLQGVDLAAQEAGSDQPALLVHSARKLHSSLQDHLTWVAGTRELSMIPENAVGGWWTSAN